MKKTLLHLSALMSMLGSGYAVANDTLDGLRLAQASPNTLATAAQRRADSAEQVISQAAQTAGVRACKPLTDQVTRYLVANGQSSAVVFAAPNNANARLFSNSIEIVNAQIVSYSSAHYAPTGENTCGVVFDAMTYWNESCADVSSKLLKDMKPMGLLGSKIAMFDGGPAMRMFLMPAGPGCIQIKKEVLY
jgi:hypothetical protein